MLPWAVFQKGILTGGKRQMGGGGGGRGGMVCWDGDIKGTEVKKEGANRRLDVVQGLHKVPPLI